jgi:hypothetical protein
LEVHDGVIEGPPENFRGKNGGVESLNPVASDFQHFDEEQNPDPDPHQNEKSTSSVK